MEAIKAELAALRTRVSQLETKLEAETSKRVLLEEEVAKLKDGQQSQPPTSFKKGSFMKVEKKRSDTDTQDLSSNSSSPRSSGGSPRGENGHEELSSSFGNTGISSHNSSNNPSNNAGYAANSSNSIDRKKDADRSDRKTEWVKVPLRTSEAAIPPKVEEDKVLFDTVEHRTVREGLLEKMGGTRPSWKVRWFRLQQGSMFYYKQQKDKKPIGEIVLSNCSVFRSNSKRPFEFTIKVPDRDWLLCGNSEDEANQWVEAIKSCGSKSSITYV